MSPSGQGDAGTLLYQDSKLAPGVRPTASTPMPLDYGDVHVWYLWLDVLRPQATDLEGVLSSDERARARCFRHQHLAQRYVAVRGALRHLLGCYLGEGPASIRLQYGPHGKPALAAPHTGTPCQFNVSHSGELAVIAFSHRCLGVDIECVRLLPNAHEIAALHFTPKERSACLAVPGARRMEMFFSIWARKEAFVKALGKGHAFPIANVEVIETQPLGGDWWLEDLPPRAGYRGTLVVEGKPGKITCLEWRS